MTQLRTLIAATDLSAPARHAAARAGRIARACGARLVLLHVVNQGTLTELREMLGAGAPAVEERLLAQGREELGRLAGDTASNLGIEPHPTVASGPVAGAISERADAEAADLLVVGARGESYLRRRLLGSTAERLLRRTVRPILVVKQTPILDYRRVLVPVDFSAWSAASIALARALAPGAELVLLHAFNVPFEGKLRYAGVDEQTVADYRGAARREALGRLRTLAIQAGLEAGSVRMLAQLGDPSTRVLEAEQEFDCDLIVLGKHGRGAMEELLLGSVTKQVLAESACDVVVSASSSA
jgi:nucleotide-binding universal stress UspA family protein